MNPEELLVHTGFVQGLARRLVLDEHRAADLAQDTWLAALRHPPAPGKPLRSWLSTVIRNLTINLARGERRRIERERSCAMHDGAPSSDEIVEKMEIRGLLIKAVLKLNDPYRTAIILRFYEGLSSKEIAKRLKIPAATVRTRINRGVNQLRTRLDAACNDNRDEWRMALAPIAGLVGSSLPAGVSIASTTASTGAFAMALKFKILLTTICFIGVAIPLWFIIFDGNKLPANGLSEMGAAGETFIDPINAQKNLSVIDDPINANKKTALKSSRSGLLLKGGVFTRNNNQPIESATILNHQLPFKIDHSPLKGKTNDSGEFSFTTVLEENSDISSFLVTISAVGFKDLEACVPMNIMENRLTCGPYYLEENQVHIVRINNTDGDPIAGACLSLAKLWSDGVPFLNKVSDSKGHVKILDHEIERRTWLLYRTNLLVTAPGMADYFHIIYDKDDPHLPSEIVMSPQGYWQGRIVDAKTGIGLWGAKVAFAKSLDVMEEEWPEKACIKTDDLGRFKIRKCKLSQNSDPRFYVWATGYEAATFKDDIPELVKLSKIGNTRKGLVVHAETGLPLTELKLQIIFVGRDMKAEGATDHMGYFDFPVLEGKETCLQIKAKGFRRNRVKLLPETTLYKDWTIRLKPLINRKLTINVIDEIERPVAGAFVQVRYCDVIQDVIYSNHQGKAVFNMDLFDQSSTIKPYAKIYISRNGYCSINPAPVPIAKNSKLTLTYVIKRGDLSCNIKVPDEKRTPYCRCSP